VAIISPYPVEDVSRGFSEGEDDPQARIICATVRGVRVVNLYVPNGQEVGTDKYAYKLGWMERITGELRRQGVPDRPLVLVGDFNVAMDDRDLYDPDGWRGRVLFSEPEQEAARDWLDAGLSDCFRKHHDGAGLYSWWDYRAGAFESDRGLRIDHLWATPELFGRCTDCRVIREPRGWEKPSDHAPVMAAFDGVD
jgi:exodeoxyribonuclease-3